MKLESLESASFGVLDIAAPVVFEPGLNVCVAPNQTGKTTLLTLVEWMLYGVPPHGRRRNQAGVERYRPWDGSNPQAVLTLAPEHPDWPERVTISVQFDDFTPQVREAGAARSLAGGPLYTVDKNGSWDIGQQLTGLGREALRASLLAPQGEIDNVLRQAQLRKLLSIDLAELVEDPERASLETALSELDKPVFTLGDVSQGPVQIGSMLRKATEQWQMTQGELESQRERYERLADQLAEREKKEGELAEAAAALDALGDEDQRLLLAAAHWRFTEIDRLHGQLQEWQPRLKEAPWLAEFPTGLQRELDTWSAEYRGLLEQIAAAEGRQRDAEALRLRAPYVEQVRVEAEPDVVRWHERLAGVRGEKDQHETRAGRAAGRLADIDRQLEKRQAFIEHVATLDSLRDQRSVLSAAETDLAAAGERMREYGEGRDAADRTRMEELEGQLQPYRGCLSQAGEYLGERERLRSAARELELQRGRLADLERGGGTAQVTGGGVLALLGLAGLLLGFFNLLPPDKLWMAIAVSGLLLAGGLWMLARGLAQRRATGSGANRLRAAIEEQETSITSDEQAAAALASRICTEHELADEAWEHLVSVIPVYQQLRLSMEEYHQALRDRDGANDRRAAAWRQIRQLTTDAPAEADSGWLDERLRLLGRLRELTNERLDEVSKHRDEGHELERLARDEQELLGKLTLELEPLGLSEALLQDADAAIRQYQAMAVEAKEYRELLRRAQEAGQLEKRLQDQRQNLARLLGPLGLSALATDDPEGAVRQFELLSEEAARYARLSETAEDAEAQAQHLSIDRDEYVSRWQAAPQAERERLAELVSEGSNYDELMQQRHRFDDKLESSRHHVDQLRREVERLRERVAKDDDVRDELEEAQVRELQARQQLETVRRWQRALELLAAALGSLQQELSSRLAPQLTAELQAVLASAPVAGVKHAALSGQLELMLTVANAPPGLDAADLLERLSVGARLQLALALRIAVARSLGAERPPCLLLDEPLAELDDERAAGCLGYLAQLADNHQVVLTTCHTQHYEWLAKRAGVEANLIALG